MNVLITGGAGFIGSCLSRKLRQEGYDVISYDLKKSETANFSFVADINDLKKLSKAISQCQYVFHLAAIANVDQAWVQAERTLTVNIEGTYMVAQCCEQASVPLSYASTLCVYGNTAEHPSTEDSICIPTDVYGASKLVGENVVRKIVYSSYYNILRFGTTYGPHMREALAVHRFITQISEGKPLTIHGSGLQTRCMIYIDDLVEACYRVLQQGVTNETLNLASEEELSALKLAEMICDATGKPKNLIFVPDRPGQIMIEQVSIAKASRLLSWKPKMCMKEGIQKTLEWMRK